MLLRYCILITGCVALLLSSCSKEETAIVSVDKITLDENLALRDIVFINDTLAYVCGGSRDAQGAIWRSTDGGDTWHEVFRSDDHCIYTLEFYDSNNGFAGGDKLMLLRTADGGNTWEDEFSQFSFEGWEDYVTPIRSVRFLNDYTIIAIGGDSYFNGFMFRSYNWGQNWIIKNYSNQFNDIVMPDSRHAWICGYGIMYFSADSCNTLQTVDYREDNFTAMDFADSLNGLACGYNGGIYLSKDGGLSWEEKIKSNGTFGERDHLNDICYCGPQTAFAAGNGGLIMISTDGGESWSPVNASIDADLHAVYPKNAREIFVCASDGAIYHIML